LRTGGGVVDPGGVAIERSEPSSRVVATDGVVVERLETKGYVVGAAGEALERILTLGGIGAGIGSVRCRSDPESVRGQRKRKAAEREEENGDK
jgi:hypothetical protein